MARFRVPPYDVAPIEVDPVTKQFRWTADWYDAIKVLERLQLVDLADVSTTAPTNTQVLIYNSTSKLWTPGAN